MSWKATAYVKSLKIAPDGSPLTRSEKLLMLILADYHNDELRGAWPSGQTLAKDALLSLRHVRTLLSNLKGKGILCTSKRMSAEGDFDTTLYHFHALDCDENHGGGSELSSLPVVKPVHHGSEPGITTVVSGAALPVVLGGGHAYKDEPPVGTITEPTHTQTPVLPLLDASPAAAAPEAEERVCVTHPISFQNYLDYARAQPSFHTPEAWAMKHYQLRDADVLVCEWLGKRSPEHVAEARTSPVNKNLFYGEALDIVRSMKEVGRPPLEVIADMPLDPEVRQRLIEKFAGNSPTQQGP